MEVPNKRELQQVAFNDLPDIKFQGFMNLIKNAQQKHVLFW